MTTWLAVAETEDALETCRLIRRLLQAQVADHGDRDHQREDESESRVDREVHDLVVGQGEEGVDLLDPVGGQCGKAEDGGVVEGRGNEVFPSQSANGRGILNGA